MPHEEQKHDFVMYQGRNVLRENFRVYVYGFDNQKKLVNSYEAFIEACASGEWFPSVKDIPDKPKQRKKAEE